jgi:hypothetical protein
VTSWACVEARSHEEALRLFERLAGAGSTLVQAGDHAWTVYIAAEGVSIPEALLESGVEAARVSVVGDEGLPPAER